jgi:hypothetical protein
MLILCSDGSGGILYYTILYTKLYYTMVWCGILEALERDRGDDDDDDDDDDEEEDDVLSVVWCSVV